MSCVYETPVRSLDPAVMHEATDVLASMGMSVSDAFTLMMSAIARNKRLPAEMDESLEIPNAETREAFEDILQRRNLTKATDAHDLFRQLGI